MAVSGATPAIAVLSAGALATARRVRAALGGGEILGRAGRVAGADRTADDMQAVCREIFAAGRPLVGICAAGILIRQLAPDLQDKRAEPPVLAVSADGASAVPLLGGHAGANRMAERIARALGGHAAITTAGDARFGVALDDPPAGWVLANPEAAKGVMARLLDGEPARVDAALDWLDPERLPRDDAARLHLRATTAAARGDADTLVYHPRALAVGVGCERGADPEAVAALVHDTLAEAGLAPASVGAVVSLDVKADEAAVHAVAERYDAPARFFPAGTLDAETPRLATPSEAVYREVGCHGVAEGAALAAAGPDGRLAVAKRRGARATCAVAEAPAPLDPAGIGRPRGRLAIVGIGPGQASWLTPEAQTWLHWATDVVGYRLYMDIVEPLPEATVRHPMAMGTETERARHALDLAAEGRDVALISSGDAQIYAMGALVFELLECEPTPARKRVAINVAPGISAFQAAAARAGAPLGHDFCCISLSDLLTPWAVIENRLHAAAQGDFVVALYNPVSRRRTGHLLAARDILLEARPPETPVVLARNLGREGESVSRTTLAQLDPAGLDMLTLVLVGSAETRAVPRSDGGAWLYTPRGYAAKRGDDP